MHITEKRIEIRAPVERVFDLFSDFESFPRWMKNIREVRYTGRRFTRWAAVAPLGTEVEWEAETTHFEPDHRIAWRSVRGDVETEGEVIFEETRRGTTLMRVVLGYQLPAGRLGELVARLFGKNPEHQLEDDLARFAAVAEGRRRAGGARRDREREDRELSERRTTRERAVGPQRRRRELDEDDERRADRSGWEDERAEREEEWEAERRREAARRFFNRDDERRASSRRYALTPRERELERERRERDYGYSEEAFRRGVDKLMHEPPSRRWRRWD